MSSLAFQLYLGPSGPVIVHFGMLIYFHDLHRHARYFAAGDDSLRSDTPNWRIYESIWDLDEDMRQKNQYWLIYLSSRNWRVYASEVANLW